MTDLMVTTFEVDNRVNDGWGRTLTQDERSVKRANLYYFCKAPGGNEREPLEYRTTICHKLRLNRELEDEFHFYGPTPSAYIHHFRAKGYFSLYPYSITGERLTQYQFRLDGPEYNKNILT